MGARTDASLSHRNPADLSDFRRYFRSRKHTAQPRLRPLAQLDFDHANGCRSHGFSKFFHGKTPAIVPTTKISRPNLPNDIPALAMISRNPTLPRILHAAGNFD